MNHPERVLLEPFLVAGITARTNNAAEMDAKPQKSRCSERIFRRWRCQRHPQPNPNSPIYGVYHRYASDANGDYSLTAGVRWPVLH